jgi:hypothetical protein
MEDNRSEIFNQIKTLMQAYAPPMTPKMDDETHYDLWSIKDLTIEGRKRKEVYLAGLIIQKSYVGFYYMPVYVSAEAKRAIPEELLRLLKGKSCFHIKQLDQVVLEQIRAALKYGFESYQERGWV